VVNIYWNASFDWLIVVQKASILMLDKVIGGRHTSLIKYHNLIIKYKNIPKCTWKAYPHLARPWLGQIFHTC